MLKRTSQRGGIHAGLEISGIGVALSIGACLLTLTDLGAHPWVAWLSPLPLFFAIRLLGRNGAALCGAIWGALILLFGSTDLANPHSSSLPSTVLLIAIPAVYAGFGAHLTRRIGFHPLFLGLGWVAVEFALRPVGFQQGLLSGVEGDYPFVHQASSLFGYVFVAFLVAWANASLLGILATVRFVVPRLIALLGLSQFAGRSCPRAWLHAPILYLTQGSPRAPPLSSL